MKTTTKIGGLAAIVGALATPAQASSIDVTPFLSDHGVVYSLENNTDFNISRLEMNTTNYNHFVDVGMPPNWLFDGRSGDQLNYTATIDVPNVGPFSVFDIGFSYEGPYSGFDLREHTDKAGFYTPLEFLAFDGTGSKSALATLWMPTTDIGVLSDPSTNDVCAGLPPGQCDYGTHPVPIPSAAFLFAPGLAMLYGLGKGLRRKEE